MPKNGKKTEEPNRKQENRLNLQRINNYLRFKGSKYINEKTNISKVYV